jgi:hypothetical protein
MYTSYIGKKFLSLYKEKENKPDDYSARQFFDDVLFPMFFDDPITLLWVHNSPFDQLNKADAKKRNDHYNKNKSEPYYSLKDDPIARFEKKEELYAKISAKEISGSTAVGFYVADIKGNTSGQVTTLPVDYSDDDIIASWIGQALSVGLKGGYVLIDNSEILSILSDGWQFYRQFISQTPKLKGNQIETWNAYWLSHKMSKVFDENNPLLGLKFELQGDEAEKGVLSIPTLIWSKLVFNLSSSFPLSTFTCYAYFLGKTNNTLGFINIYLPKIRYLYELRDILFLNGKENVLTDKQIGELETFHTFKNACRIGTIGLEALEPAKLREFMPKGIVEYAQGKDFKFTDENSKNIFSLYKLWIIAMLNKTELLQLAADVAKSLHSLEREKSDTNRGKTTQTQSSKELLESKSLKVFIDGLTENINENNSQTFKNVVDQVVKMPSDNFPLFITLIRFEYSYQKNNSSHQTN